MNRLARFIWPVFWAFCALSGPWSARADSDCLSFRDGDTLYGKLLEIKPGSLIRWQHADTSEPIDFKPQNVAQIDFAPQPLAGASTNSSCKIVLANGDSLAGNFVGCDRDALILDTWCGQAEDSATRPANARVQSAQPHALRRPYKHRRLDARPCCDRNHRRVGAMDLSERRVLRRQGGLHRARGEF